MAKFKRISYIIISLLMLSIAFAITDTIPNFTDQDNPFNFNIQKGVNITYYLPVPLYSYVESMNLSLSGIINKSLNFTFSSFPTNDTNTFYNNLTIYNSGSVSGLPNIVDGDLTTYEVSTSGSGTSNFIINISSEINLTNITLHITTYTDNKSIALPDFCYSDDFKFSLTSTSAIDQGANEYLNLYCNNRSSGIDYFITNLEVGPNNNYANYYEFYFTANTYTMPSNVSVYLNNNLNSYIDNYISKPRDIFLNTTSINNIISDGCTCNNCSISGSNCLIPIIFNSNTPSILQVNITNSTYSYGIDNCSNSFNIPSNATAFNFSFIDSNNASLLVNISSNIEYLGNNYGNDLILESSMAYCVYPNWAEIYVNFTPIEYRYSPGIYTYYSHNALFDNITNNIFLQITDSPAEVTATVYDQYNKFVENAYIYVQEYDISTNTYNLIGVYNTNFEGQSKLYLTLNTIFYRFLIYYPETTLLETTTPTYIYQDSISFQVKVGEDTLEDYYTLQDITHNLNYNNETFNFRFIYSDTSSSISQGCLKIYLNSIQDYALYNSTCLSSTSGTILLNIENVSGKTYYAKSSVIMDGEEYVLDSAIHYFPSEDARDTIGFMGIIIAIILTIAFMFTMMWSIPIGVMMIPLPTLILSSIGFIAVSVPMAIGLELAAIVIAIFIGRRG